MSHASQTISARAPQGSNARRLRNFLIHRRFQLRWVGSIVVLTTLLFGTLGGFLYWQEVNASQALLDGLNRMYEPEEAAMMAELFTAADGGVVWGLLATGAALIITLAGMSVVLTHRVAGPMYAMSCMHESVAAGDYKTRRRFRAGDEFQEVSDSFQVMVGAIREREEAEIARLTAIRTVEGLSDEARTALTELLEVKRARVE